MPGRCCCDGGPFSRSARERDYGRVLVDLGDGNRTNLVQARKFSEQLEEAINRYTNRALTASEIIAELVKLAKQMRDERTATNNLVSPLLRRPSMTRSSRTTRRCWRWATPYSKRSPLS